MQPGVCTLIILDVNGNLWASLQMGPVRQLVTFGISPDHVILLTRRDALLEFATAVGIKLPPRLPVVCAANFYFKARERTVIRPPDGAEDHSVIVRLLAFAAIQDRAECKEN